MSVGRAGQEEEGRQLGVLPNITGQPVLSSMVGGIGSFITWA